MHRRASSGVHAVGLLLLLLLSLWAAPEHAAGQQDGIGVNAYTPADNDQQSDYGSNDTVLDYTDGLDCGQEQQIVMCGQIPWSAQLDRRQCCFDNRVVQLPDDAVAAASVAAAQQADISQNIVRADLSGALATPPNFYFGTCTSQATAPVPTYKGNYSAPGVSWQQAPVLSKARIQRIKADALSRLSVQLRNDISKIRAVNHTSGFVHPGTIAGPAELALMRQRLNLGTQVQKVALNSLLTGDGVKAKVRPAPDGTSWAPPTGTPVDGYYGPFPMSKVLLKWSGYNYQGVTCPGNYPSKVWAAVQGPKQWHYADAVKLGHEQGQHEQCTSSTPVNSI
jgi:hypothetical protein